jgi:hypothetical protein
MPPIHLFCQCVFFHSDLHVLISNNYLRGSSRVGSLGNFEGIFIILHIVSCMLEIKVYSIIVSNLFGVTIVVNFLCAIV